MTHGPSTKSDNFIKILQYWENCLRNDYSNSCVTFVLVTLKFYSTLISVIAVTFILHNAMIHITVPI